MSHKSSSHFNHDNWNSINENDRQFINPKCFVCEYDGYKYYTRNDLSLVKVQSLNTKSNPNYTLQEKQNMLLGIIDDCNGTQNISTEDLIIIQGHSDACKNKFEYLRNITSFLQYRGYLCAEVHNIVFKNTDEIISAKYSYEGFCNIQKDFLKTCVVVTNPNKYINFQQDCFDIVKRYGSSLLHKRKYESTTLAVKSIHNSDSFYCQPLMNFNFAVHKYTIFHEGKMYKCIPSLQQIINCLQIKC